MTDMVTHGNIEAGELPEALRGLICSHRLLLGVGVTGEMDPLRGENTIRCMGTGCQVRKQYVPSRTAPYLRAHRVCLVGEKQLIPTIYEYEAHVSVPLVLIPA